MSGYRTLIADVCRILEHHGSLTLRQLAETLGAPVGEVRRQAEAYADLDTAATLESYLGDASYLLIDPADPDDWEAPPSDDDWVVLKDSEQAVLGIEQFDADVLGPLYQAAEELLLEEPYNDDLRDAAALLRKRFLAGMRRPRHYNARAVGLLGSAIRECRKVRIVYSRAWEPGVTERVIEPYVLIHTSRGAEVDAGPIDEQGQIRTFLVNRIRSLEVLDETFDRPGDAQDRSAVARQPTTVVGYVTHEGRWAIEKWSEDFSVKSQDAAGMAFEAQVLPPVPWRCALMMLMAGPDCSWDGDKLDREVGVLAQRLIEQHRL
jgi:proteasome accessory factor C